jgi:hypothetical protein
MDAQRFSHFINQAKKVEPRFCRAHSVAEREVCKDQTFRPTSEDHLGVRREPLVIWNQRPLDGATVPLHARE